MTGPTGIWTTKGPGGPSPERVAAIRPVLERAMTEGVTLIEDGGFTWIYQPLDPDPLRPADDPAYCAHGRSPGVLCPWCLGINEIPDDPEPTRRRGCPVSVLPYLVVALVVLWWRS